MAVSFQASLYSDVGSQPDILCRQGQGGQLLFAERVLFHGVSRSQARGIPIRLVSVIPSGQSHAHEEDHLRQRGERLVAMTPMAGLDNPGPGKFMKPETRRAPGREPCGR